MVSTSGLKRYEDSLDILVCAWVGAKYLKGEALPYGDDTAAIWVP
jgi:predicted RNase H-like nuclease